MTNEDEVANSLLFYRTKRNIALTEQYRDQSILSEEHLDRTVLAIHQSYIARQSTVR